MGGGQSKIDAFEAGRREAYHESSGPKEKLRLHNGNDGRW